LKISSQKKAIKKLGDDLEEDLKKIENNFLDNVDEKRAEKLVDDLLIKIKNIL